MDNPNDTFTVTACGAGGTDFHVECTRVNARRAVDVASRLVRNLDLTTWTQVRIVCEKDDTTSFLYEKSVGIVFPKQEDLKR